MVVNYITIDSLLERINRHSIPGGYWNLEEIKEWVYDAIRKLDDKQSTIKAEVDLEIIDSRVKIPADVETIQQVILTEEDTRLQEILYDRQLDSSTYIINAGYIYVDFETGLITLQYYTIPVDENNRPLIPDNNYYISGIEAFVLFMIGKRAYWQGKILERQLSMLEQEWAFYNIAAPASQKMTIMKDRKRFRRIHNKYGR